MNESFYKYYKCCSIVNKQVTIFWKTKTEEETCYFIIEDKSEPGNLWKSKYIDAASYHFFYDQNIQIVDEQEIQRLNKKRFLMGIY